MGPLSAAASTCSSKGHVVIFPFMSKGHTVPLLHLARMLLDRGVGITIFTTMANHSFISQFLEGADVSIVDLPFPDDISGVPPGIQSTDKLPSMSLFLPFANGIKVMQPFFEEELEKIHTQVSCIISDGFLPWTLQSASRFGIPRLSFFGMSYYASVLCQDVLTKGLLSLHESGDEPFTLVDFPWVKLTRNDFDEPFDKKDPRGPHLDFILESGLAINNSHGLLMNSFYELEQEYADYLSHKNQYKYWSIGPLCLTKPQKAPSPCHRPKWMHWLDEKLSRGCSVIYVAFGSQARVSPAQLHEIALGLEESKANYLWVVKKNELEKSDPFKDKIISERGMLVNEWVDQKEILEHPAVQGFLSHCGWNSVLEAICAEVPILAWPLMAEQFLNAKMVAEEIKVGLRVNTVDGSAKGFVTGKSLKDTVVELMEGEKGKESREKVKEVGAAARAAVAEGGSSWKNLNNLVAEIHEQKGNAHC